MNFKKLFLSSFLALGVLGVTACGNTETPNTDEPNNGEQNNDQGNNENTPVYDLAKGISDAKAEIDSYMQNELFMSMKTDDGTVKAAADAAKAELDQAKSKENVEISLTNGKEAIKTAIENLKDSKPIKVYFVGDSTVSAFADKYILPRYGYGTQFSNYLTDKATVINLAISGRSSKSFLTEDNYATLKDNITKDDVLIIGFGHNDEKSDDAARFTDASKPSTDPTSFKYSLLENYVKVATNVGATPILCTPIVRLDPNDAYTGSVVHDTSTGNYQQAIIELGQETNTTVVDLTTLTKDLYVSKGFEEAKYYHAVTAGMFKSETDQTVVENWATVDKTHINEFGAKQVGYFIASEILKTKNPLKGYIKNDIVAPTKENDYKTNPSYVYKPYAAPDLVAYKNIIDNGEEDATTGEVKTYNFYKTITEGWYGTAFGDTGGSPMSEGNGFRAKETTEGVFEVGQSAASAKGKFGGSNDGFAMLFRQVPKDDNFTLSADIKITTLPKDALGNVTANGQNGFGLMLRDDIYLRLTTADASILSNYVTAGMLVKPGASTMFFQRENAALAKGTAYTGEVAVGDVYTCTIERVGQSVKTTITVNGVTYENQTTDFDFFAKDNDFMYVGIFANRGIVVEATNVVYTKTGTSQGA